MDKLALLLAGPILSALGVYFKYRKKSVNQWMKERRIDRRKPRNTSICEICGAPLKIKTTFSGPNAGKKFIACSNYPDCRYIDWETSKKINEAK